MSRMKSKSISLDTWEEVPVARIFRAAQQNLERDFSGPKNSGIRRPVPGMSVALAAAVFATLPAELSFLYPNTCHRQLCATQEIRTAMMQYQEIAWKRTPHELAEILSGYFQILEAYSIEVGLTYRFQAGTLAGEFIYNTPNGPQTWE